MSHDHSQNHYGPNASFDGHDSDLASAGMLIESLRQQLAAAHAARVSAQASGLRLLDQLVASQNREANALAACELKDEALQNCEGMLDELRDYPITHDAIIEALAIQPDDSALKAWVSKRIASTFRKKK